MSVNRRSDRLFINGTMVLAATVLLVTVAILIGIASGARLSLATFGLGFLTGTVWDPAEGHEVFGALPFIYGTLVTGFIALLLAGLVGVGGAIFLAELAPSWIRTPISFLVELL